jgi:hypothetical protein
MPGQWIEPVMMEFLCGLCQSSVVGWLESPLQSVERFYPPVGPNSFNIARLVLNVDTYH